MNLNSIHKPNIATYYIDLSGSDILLQFSHSQGNLTTQKPQPEFFQVEFLGIIGIKKRACIQAL
jgi:hypothetical protein